VQFLTDWGAAEQEEMPDGQNTLRLRKEQRTALALMKGRPASFWQTVGSSLMAVMLVGPAVIGLFAILLSHTDLVAAASSPANFHARESVSIPLPPEYVIERDGSVTLRICFNWSCARRQTMTFTPDDMALLKRRMAVCPGTSLHDRLQHVRIGIWQMELLAQKYQPLLANDLPINEFEAAIAGRTDCVDNASNSTTYLHILRDIGELAGWTVSSPRVRSRFDLNAVHWTAVIIDTETGLPWSVDSWYRPNGHLPMVMPLRSWIDKKKGWEPPFQDINSVPHSIDELCNTQPLGTLVPGRLSSSRAAEVSSPSMSVSDPLNSISAAGT
jgi:hypothetical protein